MKEMCYLVINHAYYKNAYGSTWIESLLCSVLYKHRDVGKGIAQNLLLVGLP